MEDVARVDHIKNAAWYSLQFRIQTDSPGPLVIPVTRVSSRKIRFELYWLPMGILFEIA
jgi:hypothetical protein